MSQIPQIQAPKPLTIAISGSRTIRNAALVSSLLTERACYYLSRGYAPHLHLGEAQGVDHLALLWARAMNIAPRTIFFASKELHYCFNETHESEEQVILASDWDELGRIAGSIRNAAMLDGQTLDGKRCKFCNGRPADLLIRIWDGHSPGTANAGELARVRQIFMQTYTTAGDGRWLEESNVGAP